MFEQITGRAFIEIDGIRHKTMPGATLDFGGKNRAVRVGDDSVHGWNEALTAPTVQCTFSHTPTLKLKKLQDFRNGTLDFVSDAGPIYRISSACSTAAPTLTSGGDVSVTFSGEECEEM